MNTAKTIQGAATLAVDTLEGVTDIVEGMYRNIAARPLPWGDAPNGAARGIAGIVYSGIRQVLQALRVGMNEVGGPLADQIDKMVSSTEPDSDARAAVIAAINGVLGDHLERTNNGLALPMTLNVADGYQASGKVLVMVHGLCMNDRQWQRDGHDHGRALANEFGFSPVYLSYNSGRHISTNGREFAEKLGGLIAEWSVPVESITLVGHSMGGLVIRSAFATEPEWIDKVDAAAYLGSPHHGAALERRGNWLQASVGCSPYTAPLAALGMIRSAGVTDLRHGNVVDEDWQDTDRFMQQEDCRQPTPLAAGVRHYAIAATLSETSGELSGRVLGDGLVHPSSATGRHSDPEFDLDFPAEHSRIFRGMNHWNLLSDMRVCEQLRDWLVETPTVQKRLFAS